MNKIDMKSLPADVLLLCMESPEKLLNVLYEFELERTGSRVEARNNSVALFNDAREQILSLAEDIILSK